MVVPRLTSIGDAEPPLIETFPEISPATVPPPTAVNDKLPKKPPMVSLSVYPAFGVNVKLGKANEAWPPVTLMLPGVFHAKNWLFQLCIVPKGDAS